jgi:EthD domain
MLKVFAFLTKKEGMETQAFIDYYENKHVPLICSLAPTPPPFTNATTLCGATNSTWKTARSALTS